MNFLNLLGITISGFFPLFTITTAGVFMTFKNYLNKQTNTVMSLAFSNFFSPVLCFFFISSSFDIKDFKTLIILFVSPIIGSFIGLFVGSIHSRIFKIPKSIKHAIMSLIAMQNIALVYLIIVGMCSDYGPFANKTELCNESFGYISISLFPLLMLFWIFYISFTGLDKQAVEKNLLNEIQVESKKVKISTQILKSILMPNPLACILGMIFGLIPLYKQLFFDKTTILYSIGSSFLMIGNFSLMVGQLLLGSNIYLMKGKKSSLSFSSLLSIIIVKTIVLPGIFFLLTYLCWKIELFGNNIMIAYVVFMGMSMPPAIVSMIFAEIHQNALNEVIQLMFWTYVLSMPTTFFWNVLFLLCFDE